MFESSDAELLMVVVSIVPVIILIKLIQDAIWNRCKKYFPRATQALENFF